MVHHLSSLLVGIEPKYSPHPRFHQTVDGGFELLFTPCVAAQAVFSGQLADNHIPWILYAEAKTYNRLLARSHRQMPGKPVEIVLLRRFRLNRIQFDPNVFLSGDRYLILEFDLDLALEQILQGDFEGIVELSLVADQTFVDLAPFQLSTHFDSIVYTQVQLDFAPGCSQFQLGRANILITGEQIGLTGQQDIGAVIG